MLVTLCVYMLPEYLERRYQVHVAKHEYSTQIYAPDSTRDVCEDSIPEPYMSLTTHRPGDHVVAFLYIIHFQFDHEVTIHLTRCFAATFTGRWYVNIWLRDVSPTFDRPGIFRLRASEAHSQSNRIVIQAHFRSAAETTAIL